jgi:hypothetical protein
MTKDNFSVFFAVFIGILLLSGRAEATPVWWGVCTNGEGRDIKSVRGPSKADLERQCRGLGARLRNDAREEVGCSADDTYPGCELGKKTPMCTGNIPPPPDDVRSPRPKRIQGTTVSLENGESGRTCVHVPKSTDAKGLYCDMYDSGVRPPPEGATFRCGYRYCSGITTARFTVFDAESENIFCWTVTNRRGRKIDFTLYGDGDKR